ncbi:MAG: hypothetical protein RIM99_13150 [Cyclobacteriaceae bacterium]
MIRAIFILLLFSSQCAFAQNFLSWQFKDRYFSFTLGSGSATYFGELNNPNTINGRLSQINAGIEARLLSKVGARIEATWFSINGSDSNAPDSSFQRQRNLSFNSRNFQIQLNGIYYLKRYQGDFYKRWIADPYLLSGVGYMFYNPTADLGGETFSLREALTEGTSYEKWTLTIPLGMGLKFKINEFANFNVEASWHFTLTDYLDDVSGNYASEFTNATAELLSNRKDEIGVISPEIYDQIVPGSVRGDPSNKDNFLLLSFKLELFIPAELFSGKNSPVIKKPSY